MVSVRAGRPDVQSDGLLRRAECLITRRSAGVLEEHHVANLLPVRCRDDDLALGGDGGHERQREVADAAIEQKLLALAIDHFIDRGSVGLAGRVVVISAAFDRIVLGRARQDPDLIPPDRADEPGISEGRHFDSHRCDVRAWIPFADNPLRELHPDVDGLLLGRIEVEDRRFHANPGRQPSLDVVLHAIDEAGQIARPLLLHPVDRRAVFRGDRCERPPLVHDEPVRSVPEKSVGM